MTNPMNMLELAKAMRSAEAMQTKKLTHSILYYGPPKSGKTALVATLAKAADYKRIYWFDLENGFDTILTMWHEGKLTDEELAKIVLIRIPDTRDNPTGIETLLKAIAGSAPVKICHEHGKANCQDCTKAGKGYTDFHYRSLTPEDAVVIDSLSQAGASAMNLACRGKPAEYKPTFDEYGAQGKWLGDILTHVQAAAYCDIHCITHVFMDTDDDGKNMYFPLCGTKAFSANTAKFFGTVVYVTKKLKQHRAESSTTTSINTQAGSRLGIVLEKGELNLPQALVSAGFFKGGESGQPMPVTPTQEKAESAPAKVADASISLADRLKLQKQSQG